MVEDELLAAYNLTHRILQEPRPLVDSKQFHGLNACVRDAAEFMRVVREVHDAVAANPATMAAGAYRLAVVMKAMMFFVTALQDRCYGVLRQLLGQSTSKWNTMAAAQEKCPAVAALISREVPSYFDWFDRQRELRNEMKGGLVPGATYAHGLKTTITVVLNRADERTPVVVPIATISVATLENDLRMSAALVAAIERTAMAGPPGDGTPPPSP
jgi:hypothetical protein